MPRPDRDDSILMGRFLFFILLVGTGWFLLNVIGVSIDPRGVGTQIHGREVTRDVAPSLKESKLNLAQSVQIQDGQPLLR
jgi:hypothetical protein